MTTADRNRPFDAWFYRTTRRTAARRGEGAHRERLLEGLAGRVLEVGAADGENLARYPPQVTELVAVEPERHLRAGLERAARTVPFDVTVVAALAEDLPLDDACVDAAVCSLVLCEVGDQDRALAELRRVVRPGGELRFYEHVRPAGQPLRAVLDVATRSGVWPLVAGGCHPDRETLQAIEAAGFAVERLERFAFRASLISPPLPYVLGCARRR